MGLNMLLPLIFTSLILQLASGQGNAISCTAGNFTKCASAKVTCHFNQDVKQNRKNFNVVQYPYKQGASSSDAGNYVLVCNWGEGESLECKVEDGYTFDKQVGTSLTLGIPDVKTSVAGVYVCQLVPDGGIPLETCKLDVQDASATCAACPNATCHDVCANQEYIIAVLVIVVLVFLMMIVFGTAVAIYIKLNYRWEKKTSGNAAVAGAHNSGTCCGLTLTRLSDDTESAAPARSHKRSSKATGNPQEAAALLKKKGEAATSNEDLFAGVSKTQAPTASSKDVTKPGKENPQDQSGQLKKRNQEVSSGSQPGGHASKGVGQHQGDGKEDDVQNTGSFEHVDSTGTKEGTRRDRTHPPDTSGQRSPGENTSPGGRRLGMGPTTPPLLDEESDNWSLEQVSQWLTEQGLQHHVNKFKYEKINGAALLGLGKWSQWYMNMESGPGGNDKSIMREKIKQLKAAVEQKKKNPQKDTRV